MRGARKMNQRQFWLLESAWPDETLDWVFLGRAILRIGRMLYPDEWRDDDPSRGLTVDEWRDEVTSIALREISRDAAEAATRKKAMETVSRARSTFMRIAADCRSAVLESGIRPVPGGDITPLPASVWATEYHRWADRFVFCQMRIDDPFAYRAGRFGPAKEKGMGYLFIRRAGLEQITWPTPEAIRASFPEGVPERKVLLGDKRFADLLAGVDEYSAVYHAKVTPGSEAERKTNSRTPSTARAIAQGPLPRVR
jgi:hypothetical protein